MNSAETDAITKIRLLNIVLVTIAVIGLTFLALCSWSLAKWVWPSIFMSIQSIRDGRAWNPGGFTWVLNRFIPLTLLGVMLLVVLKERYLSYQNIKLGVNIIAIRVSVAYAAFYVLTSMSLMSVLFALLA